MAAGQGRTEEQRSRPRGRTSVRPWRPPIWGALLVLLAVGGAGAASPLPHGPPAACGYTVALAAAPQAGTTPLLVRFNATVSSGTPAYDSWAFGDGTFWNSTGPAAGHPLHRFSSVGTYESRVEVAVGGCLERAYLNITVSAGPLTVAVVAHPLGADSPSTIVFNSSVTGGTGTYVSATWQFGDGGVGSGLDVAYTYARPGRYVAFLNVTDSGGHWAIASVNVNVTAAPGTASSGGGLGEPGSWTVLVLLVAAASVAGAIWTVRRSNRAPRTEAPAREGPAPGPPPGPTPRPVPEAPPEAPGAATGAAGPLPLEPEAATSPDAPVRPAEVAAEAPLVRGPTPPKAAGPEAFRVTEKVILHLGRQGRLSSDEVAPPEMTQQGIAEATGARQNTVTNVLRRLVAAGVVDQDVRHVRGRDRRLRVYFFTARGEAVYEELRRRPGALDPSRGKAPPPRR